MSDRFGMRDLLLVVALAVMLGLQVLVLQQKNHDAALLVRQNEKLSEQLAKSGQQVDHATGTLAGLKTADTLAARIADLAVEQQKNNLSLQREQMTLLREHVRLQQEMLAALRELRASGAVLPPSTTPTQPPSTTPTQPPTTKTDPPTMVDDAAETAALRKRIAALQADRERLDRERAEASRRPRGDWLVWALPAEPRQLNPITHKDLYARYIVKHGKVFETLIDRDLDTMEFKPLLASHWEMSPDGKIVTFYLRENLTFSDGHALTADDVVFTVETIIKNPNVDAPNVRNYYDDLQRVEKIDDRTVRFHFSKKYYKSLEVAGETEVLPKHIYSRFFKPDPQKPNGPLNADGFNKIRGSKADNPEDPLIGSGPYVFEKWITGDQVVLLRNEKYWGAAPSLDRLVYRFIKNEQATLQALEKGEVDMMSPTPRQFDAYGQDPNFLAKYHLVKFASPLSGYNFIGYNMRNKLLADKRIRNALTMILDRELIIRDMWFRIGLIANGPFFPLGKQSNPQIKPLPFDMDAARKLLAEAGWTDTNADGILDKNGEKLELEYLMTTDNKVGEEIARYFKSQAEKVGIKVTLSPLEWSSFIGKVDNQEFTICSLAWGGGSPENDPYQIWHSSQTIISGSNFVGFSNAEADKLIEQAREELDETKRNALYHRFHQIVHGEQPYTFLIARESVYFVNKRFENVRNRALRIEPMHFYVKPENQKYR